MWCSYHLGSLVWGDTSLHRLTSSWLIVNFANIACSDQLCGGGSGIRWEWHLVECRWVGVALGGSGIGWEWHWVGVALGGSGIGWELKYRGMRWV